MVCIKYFWIETFGCQMNQQDSAIITATLEKQELILASKLELADLIIFNTCSVRQKAETRVWGRLGHLNELKRQNPQLVIAVAGCMAMRLKQEIFARAPWVDLVFGPNDLTQIPQLLNKYQKHPHQLTGSFEFNDFESASRNEDFKPSSPFSASVTIIKGCNNYCSYCIVPYVRGPEVSRQSELIIQRVQTLLNKGYREITLLGQNVNSYRDPDNEKINFARLLKSLDQLQTPDNNDFFLRFITSHPKDLTDELIEVMASGRHIARYLHLPIQSGSDRILKLMNRRYDSTAYLNLVSRLRRAMPNLALSTDLICGFPSETETDFSATLELVKTIRYDTAFMFYYQERSGTAACDLPGNLEIQLRKDRLKHLVELQMKITGQCNAARVGHLETGLVESRARKGPCSHVMRTSTNRILMLNLPDDSFIGKIIEARVIRASGWVLFGEPTTLTI